MNSKKKTNLIVGLIVLFGAGFSLVLHDFLVESEREEAQARFLAESTATLLAVEENLRNAMDAVLATASFFKVRKLNVDYSEFVEFTEPFLEHHKYIQALEWIPKISHTEREQFEKEGVAVSFMHYPITERDENGNMVQAAKRDVYFPVQYVNPLEGNQPAVGFDLASNAKRLNAMQRAQNFGQITLSEAIQLVQDDEDGPGFLVFYPLYQGGKPPDEAEDREETLKGYVLGVYHVGDIVIPQILKSKSYTTAYSVVDKTMEPPEKFFEFTAARDQSSVDAAASLFFSKEIFLGGRHWELVCRPTKEIYEINRSLFPTFVPMLSFAFSCFLALYVKLTRRIAYAARREKIKADSISAAKSQFLAHLSHEIRTPMSAVLGMLDMLLKTNLAENQKHFAEVAKTSMEDTLEVLTDILDVSKIEAGKLELEKVNFDLRTTIEKIQNLYKGQVEEKGLAFHVNVDPNLPEVLQGDPLRVGQVLINLMSNALKFTSSGEIGLSVELSLDSADVSNVLFKVQDTGVGITPEDQERLFESFTQQSASTTRHYGGTGLGLPICKQLVELMGGEIRVTSDLDKKTVFEFFIPFIKPQKDMHSDQPFPPSPEGFIPLFEQPRLLVVEDNPTLQHIFVTMAEDLGCRCTVAANGEQALDALAQQDFDIMFLDCHMPVLDGFSVMKRLRKIWEGGARIPVCAMSAASSAEMRNRCLRAGMSRFLAKPFLQEDIRQVIIDLLGGVPGTSASSEDVDSGKKAEPSVSREYQAVNWQRLNALSNNQTEIKRSLIDSWLKEGHKIRRRLAEYVDSRDWSNAHIEAHGLKGAAAMFGLDGVVGVAATLERLAQAEKPKDMKTLMVRLDAELLRVEQALQAALEEMEHPA